MSYPNLDVHYAIVMGTKKNLRKDWLKQFKTKNQDYNLYEFIIGCVYYNLKNGNNNPPYYKNTTFNFLLNIIFKLILYYKINKKINMEYILEYNKFNQKTVFNTEPNDRIRRFLSDWVIKVNSNTLITLFDDIEKNCEKIYFTYNNTIKLACFFKNCRKIDH